MDVNEADRDVKLHRASPDLLADFAASLEHLLWKADALGTRRLRKSVRLRESVRLQSLLEPFQEHPQLLDPHLGKLLPQLAAAYLASLVSASPAKRDNAAVHLIPASCAIGRLLYTFCKIRGAKIVVQFFGAEAKHLEVLLSAIEDSEASRDKSHDAKSPGHASWQWEERYICLLWLSHLMLAPFDLSTISSSSTPSPFEVDERDLDLPPALPSVALRVVPLVMRFLPAPGKERDAAKTLLVRLTTRKDMQELGLLGALISWAVRSLASTDINVIPYRYIGILSYLSGTLSAAAGTSDLNPYLLSIFEVTQLCNDPESVAYKNVHSSAVARKSIIKIVKHTSVAVLRSTSDTSLQLANTGEMVEEAIGFLLEVQSDNDTPVRLAASKALSIVTLKLAPEMAGQVVEAILDSLNNNVLWEETKMGDTLVKTRDVSAVNPLEWHGLTLTLSHLLFRRSPPPNTLANILHALLLGLSFEQRATSGSSVGTNVRDAACFGIWALARRYTTKELHHVRPSAVKAATLSRDISVLQVLATELVVAACLDPAGNIRRGASAALQELIGRHPDTIVEGIAVVQVVDYHAVALRSRAMTDVAVVAALLSEYYADGLYAGLLSWRGVGDSDRHARTFAAKSVGILTSSLKAQDQSTYCATLSKVVGRLEQELLATKNRDVDRRHGLIMSLGCVLSAISKHMLSDVPTANPTGDRNEKSLHYQILTLVHHVLHETATKTSRRPELLAEAVSLLIQAACPFMTMPIPGAVSDRVWQTRLSDTAAMGAEKEIRQQMIELLGRWLLRTEKEVIDTVGAAAESVLHISDEPTKTLMVGAWLDEIKTHKVQSLGHLFTLRRLYPSLSATEQELFCTILTNKWTSSQTIEHKVSLQQCLSQGSVLKSCSTSLIHMIVQGMDDYTTDARGDIGSLVRIEAAKGARAAFMLNMPDASASEHPSEDLRQWWTEDDDLSNAVTSRIIRLSAEKLDKVRTEAVRALAVMVPDPALKAQCLTILPSSEDYFTLLLNLQPELLSTYSLTHASRANLLVAILEGYVTSADTGSEGLVRVSRNALVDFCDSTADGLDNSELVCNSLISLARDNLAEDRIIIPVLEVLAYLFDAGVLQSSQASNPSPESTWKLLYSIVQKAHFKSTNVRKLEAAVKLYGGLSEVYPEALDKLTKMVVHPFPAIRSLVIDVLWTKKGVGKAENWSKAKKEEMMRLRAALGLN